MLPEGDTRRHQARWWPSSGTQDDSRWQQVMRRNGVRDEVVKLRQRDDRRNLRPLRASGWQDAH